MRRTHPINKFIARLQTNSRFAKRVAEMIVENTGYNPDCEDFAVEVYGQRDLCPRCEEDAILPGWNCETCEYPNGAKTT